MFIIIIPLYNKQDSIQNTLKSILNQTFHNFEVLVVDDGSNDGSYLKAEELSLSDSRIHLMQKENGGVSSARNVGILHAKTDYIAFIDADDTWEPNYLEEQAKLIRDFPEASMWGVSWTKIIQNKKTAQKHEIADNFRGIVTNYWQRGLYLYWTGAIVVRKSVFNKVGYFDEKIKYGEDLDMWYRIILNYPVAYYNLPLANYVLDAENSAMNKEIPLKTHLPYFIEKYEEYRTNNKEFRQYFDRECLYRLFPYMLNKNNNSEILRILNQIDFSEQKYSFRLRFIFPKLYNWYLKLKNNNIKSFIDSGI